LKINIGNCTQVTLTIQATSVPSGVSCTPLTASATVNAGQTAVLALSCSPAPSPTPQQYWTLNVNINDPYGAGYIITDNYGNSLQAARSLTTSFANYSSNVSSVTLNAKIQFNPSNMQCSISPSTVTVNAPSGGTGSVTQNFTVSCTQTSTPVSPYSVNVKLVNMSYGYLPAGVTSYCFTVKAKYSGTSTQQACITSSNYTTPVLDLGSIQLTYSPDILELEVTSSPSDATGLLYIPINQLTVTTSDNNSTVYFGANSYNNATGTFILAPGAVPVNFTDSTGTGSIQFTVINLGTSSVTVTPNTTLQMVTASGSVTLENISVTPSSASIQPGRAVTFSGTFTVNRTYQLPGYPSNYLFEITANPVYVSICNTGVVNACGSIYEGGCGGCWNVPLAIPRTFSINVVAPLPSGVSSSQQYCFTVNVSEKGGGQVTTLSKCFTAQDIINSNYIVQVGTFTATYTFEVGLQQPRYLFTLTANPSPNVIAPQSIEISPYTAGTTKYFLANYVSSDTGVWLQVPSEYPTAGENQTVYLGLGQAFSVINLTNSTLSYTQTAEAYWEPYTYDSNVLNEPCVNNIVINPNLPYGAQYSIPPGDLSVGSIQYTTTACYIMFLEKCGIKLNFPVPVLNYLVTSNSAPKNYWIVPIYTSIVNSATFGLYNSVPKSINSMALTFPNVPTTVVINGIPNGVLWDYFKYGVTLYSSGGQYQDFVCIYGFEGYCKGPITTLSTGQWMGLPIPVLIAPSVSGFLQSLSTRYYQPPGWGTGQQFWVVPEEQVQITPNCSIPKVFQGAYIPGTFVYIWNGPIIESYQVPPTNATFAVIAPGTPVTAYLLASAIDPNITYFCGSSTTNCTKIPVGILKYSVKGTSSGTVYTSGEQEIDFSSLIPSVKSTTLTLNGESATYQIYTIPYQAFPISFTMPNEPVVLQAELWVKYPIELACDIWPLEQKTSASVQVTIYPLTCSSVSGATTFLLPNDLMCSTAKAYEAQVTAPPVGELNGIASCVSYATAPAWSLSVTVNDDYRGNVAYTIEDQYGDMLTGSQTQTATFAEYPTLVKSVNLTAKITSAPSGWNCTITPSSTTVSAPSSGTGTVTQSFTVACTSTTVNACLQGAEIVGSLPPYWTAQEYCAKIVGGTCDTYPPEPSGWCCCRPSTAPPPPSQPTPTPTPTPVVTATQPTGATIETSGGTVRTVTTTAPIIVPTPTPSVTIITPTPTPTVTVPVGVPAVSPTPTTVTPTPSPPKVSKAMIGVIAGLAALGVAGGVYFATRKKKP
jgi:hypothetical protein